MATTFKTFLNNDIATTRTLLHEAIPITGTISSGTYSDENIKTFGHGMFQSVYDYPYLSSSANHILDITVGLAASSSISTADKGQYGSIFGESNFATTAQYAKKRNIYDQMAQVLIPYDISGSIRRFDQNGNLNEESGDTKFNEAVFLNFARLLTKDEIKKGTFSIQFLTGGTTPANRSNLLTISDYGADSSFLVNSPSGEYGLLYTASLDAGQTHKAVGHVYYQAGICVLSPYIFSSAVNGAPAEFDCNNTVTITRASGNLTNSATSHGDIKPFAVLTGSTIDDFANGIRNRLYNIEFNNTTELNSTIYFCRANTGDYNYSSNPTYLSGSKIRVKGDNPFAQPVSYMTSIGLYSPNNELLAVAKLSEPLKKTPSNELTLRVRLDY